MYIFVSSTIQGHDCFSFSLVKNILCERFELSAKMVGTRGVRHEMMVVSKRAILASDFVKLKIVIGASWEKAACTTALLTQNMCPIYGHDLYFWGNSSFIVAPTNCICESTKFFFLFLFHQWVAQLG